MEQEYIFKSTMYNTTLWDDRENQTCK